MTRDRPENLLSGCGDVVVDASPGARGRHCSVTGQNRERVVAATADAQPA